MNLAQQFNSINKLVLDSSRIVRSTEDTEFITTIEKDNIKKQLIKFPKKNKIDLSKFSLSKETTLERNQEDSSSKLQMSISVSELQRKKKALKRLKSVFAKEQFDKTEKQEIEYIENTLKEEKDFENKDSKDIPNWYFFIDTIVEHYLKTAINKKLLVEILPNLERVLDNPENILLKENIIKKFPDNGDFFNNEIQRIVYQKYLLYLQNKLNELDKNINEFEDAIIPELIDKFIRNFRIEDTDTYKNKLREINKGNFTQKELEKTKNNIKEDNIKKANIFDEQWNNAKKWLRDPKNKNEIMPIEITKILNNIQRKIPYTDNPNRLLNNLDILFRYREIFKFPLTKNNKAEVDLYYNEKEQRQLENLKENGTLLISENINSKNYRISLKLRSQLYQQIITEVMNIKILETNAKLKEKEYRIGKNKYKIILIDAVENIINNLDKNNKILLNDYFAYINFNENENELKSMLISDLEFIREKFNNNALEIYNKLKKYELKQKNPEILNNLLNNKNLNDPSVTYAEIKHAELSLKL